MRKQAEEKLEEKKKAYLHEQVGKRTELAQLL